MPSDPKRLNEVMRHIGRIKAGDYPAIVGRDGDYRIVERPWHDLGEPAKLAILQDTVDWSGITNRDRAHVLRMTIDPGKITDAQRDGLIQMAEYGELLEQKARAGMGKASLPLLSRIGRRCGPQRPRRSGPRKGTAHGAACQSPTTARPSRGARGASA